jgi:trehalose 6-phosphate phosphatase
VTDVLGPLVEHATEAAVLVDFDGSLAPIVDDPEGAVALPDARDALAALVGIVARVGVVSGRPVAFLHRTLGIDGITYVGQYGLERWVDGTVVTDPRVEPYRASVEAVAAAAGRDLPEVYVERKGGVAVGLHWRGRPDRDEAVRAWAARAAEAGGLELHPGRMVVELRPPVPVDKGTVVEALSEGLVAAAFAGDDSGDLAAFDALDAMQADGRLRHSVRIGVRSEEGPPELIARADVAVAGPAGLAALLRDLGESIRRALA